MRAQCQQAIEHHRQRIYCFARSSLRVPRDAEDATQEVLIKLWQHWLRIDTFLARSNSWAGKPAEQDTRRYSSSPATSMRSLAATVTEVPSTVVKERSPIWYL